VGDLAGAHGAFVDRYGVIDYGKKLCGLVNDGYVHRHLTWHLVMAGREDGVHGLLGASDGLGRNAWFEACEEIGQPAIFVQDVKRGWGLAEEMYDRDKERAIVLQCGYALMTVTLNMLLDNLPVGVMAAFVKGGFWSMERTWAYVEQMQDEGKVAESIRELAPYLSTVLFPLAVERIQSIRDEYEQALTLTFLAMMDSTYYPQAIQAIDSSQDKGIQTNLLPTLREALKPAFSSIGLDKARFDRDEYIKAGGLKKLTSSESENFRLQLESARLIQDQYELASILSKFKQFNHADFPRLLQEARLIEIEQLRASALINLAKIDSADLVQILEVARSIRDAVHRAPVLCSLARIHSVYFAEALDTVNSISESDYHFRAFRALMLSHLSEVDPKYFSEALKAARSIRAQYRVIVIGNLAKIDATYFSEAFESAEWIEDINLRGLALSTLAEHAPEYCLPKIYQAITEITHLPTRARTLSSYLPRLPLNLPYEDWKSHLHLLAHRKRADLMGDLVTLYPAILHLGGEGAMRGVVDEMKRVCGQWK
jgi:hypothetical protein